MEVMRFSEYSKVEQRNLLMHWWYFYSKSPCNFLECNRFRKAVEKDAQMVMNMVFVATVNERGNEEILNMIRVGKFEEYWDQMVEFSGTEEFKVMYEAGEVFLIDEIVDSYRNPKSRDDNAKGVILTGISKIIKSNGYTLTSDRVYDLYEKCCINENDFCDGELVGDFTISEGINGNTIFMTDRLNQYRNDIYECIEMLPGLNRGNSFLKLFDDKKGKRWTTNQDVLDKLIQLGVATEIIYYPIPKDSWHKLPGGLPIVAASYVDESYQLLGHKPCEYIKVLERIENNIYKKDGVNGV